MKKAIIIVSSCLLIAVVALCLVWNNLNGQKTELAERVEAYDRSIQATAKEVKEMEDGKNAAEARVAELEGLLAAAEQKAAEAEEKLASIQSEMETQIKDAEDQLKESAETIESAVTRAVTAEESAQTLTEQLAAAQQTQIGRASCRERV